MHAHVGVDIEEGPTLFKPATKTTGRGRKISLANANKQLTIDAVYDGTVAKEVAIGSGAFGDVVEHYVNSNGTTELARLIKTTNTSTIPSSNPNCPLAIKIIASRTENVLETSTIREFVLRNLDDPGVVKIGAVSFRHKATVPDPTERSTFITMDRAKDSLYMVIEHANQERYDLAPPGVLYTTLPLFAVNEYKMLAYQLVRAVAYLHSERIIHGDIKAGNTLVTAIKNVPTDCLDFVLAGRKKPMQTFKLVQLTDFGIAQVNYVEPICLEHDMYTITHRPPEFIFGKKGEFWDELIDRPSDLHISPKSDIWALGCVLYKMATYCDFANTITHGRETIQNNVEVARLMIDTFGEAAFKAHPRLFPGYNTQRMRSYVSTYVSTEGNPWDNPVLAHYPGLEPLLRKMLVVDPMKRTDLFELMHEPFFADSGVANLFSKATNTPINKFVGIPYYPDTLNMQMTPVLAHMMKTFPSECDPTHASFVFNPEAYRCLAHQISSTLAKLYATTLSAWHKEECYTLESKTLALAFVWALKNSGKQLLTFSSAQLDTIAMAFITLTLKVQNQDEHNVGALVGCVDGNAQYIATTAEYRILNELDFDVFGDTPYDFVALLFQHVHPQHHRAAIEQAERTAINLIRVMQFNPMAVRQIDTIQLIDSVLDICVRSKVDAADLHLYKSVDPNYSQLKLDKSIAAQLIQTITSDQPYATMKPKRVKEIIDAIDTYHKSRVVYYPTVNK